MAERPFYAYYDQTELTHARLSLVDQIVSIAIVENASTGYIVCPNVNHDIDPAILSCAAKITVSSFLQHLPQELQPQKIIGVPRRGVEFAGALSHETGLNMGVTDRTEMNGNSHSFCVRYDEDQDMIFLDGIPSFTQPGKFFSHKIRAVKPGMIVLVADDFSAQGNVTSKYIEGFCQLNIRPVFVYVVAKDFPDLNPPQIGYRTNKLAGLPVFATVRITEMIGGNGGRIKATSEDINL